MTQTAIVIKGGDDAIVEISRKSACAMCREGGSSACAACSIFTSSKKASARAQNKVGAETGDIVEVEGSEKTIIGFAALVFILPIVLPIVGFLLFRSNHTVAITVAAAAMFLSFIVVYFISKSYEKKKPVLTITKILKKREENG